ncbi:TetR/AcrR family transcriptional regulator [bacterium]|nr:TetR/AcrR family transcriptional regulator [bacterium]
MEQVPHLTKIIRMKQRDMKGKPVTDSSKFRNTSPPGREKLASALRDLLLTKDFGSITVSEIAKHSSVNEALIYRYFGNKRGLLHGVLTRYLQTFINQLTIELKGLKSVLEKLRKLAWSTINFYDRDRVSAKILLLEVRAHKDYFESETYQTVKIYANLISTIVQEGIDNGELQPNVSPQHFRQIVLGTIEHLLLPAIIFDEPIDVDKLQEIFCDTLFDGVANLRKLKG